MQLKVRKAFLKVQKHCISFSKELVFKKNFVWYNFFRYFRYQRHQRNTLFSNCGLIMNEKCKSIAQRCHISLLSKRSVADWQTGENGNDLCFTTLITEKDTTLFKTYKGYMSIFLKHLKIEVGPLFKLQLVYEFTRFS